MQVGCTCSTRLFGGLLDVSAAPANKTTSNWSSIESTLQMSISSQCTTENDCNAKLKWSLILTILMMMTMVYNQIVNSTSNSNRKKCKKLWTTNVEIIPSPEYLAGSPREEDFPKHISQDSCNFILSQCALDYSVIGVFHDCRISFIPESAHSVPTRGSCAYVNIGFTSLWLDTLPPPVITSQL